MHRARRLLAVLALLSFSFSATEALLADTGVEASQEGVSTAVAADLVGSDVPDADDGSCPPGCSCPCPCACPAPCLLQPDPPSAVLASDVGSSVPLLREESFSSLSGEPRVPPPLP